jgi:hypothetical protein
MIILAGLMIAASLIAASPAAAAKAHASIFVFCFTSGPNTTPGYPLQCQAQVTGTFDRPAPTGTLKISAATYKGTLSSNTCSSLTNCQFTYTPKGKGSDYRKDTITAIYSGDGNYYSGRSSIKISIAASPPARLQLTCPDSVQTGTTAFCGLSIQMNGPSQFGYVALKAPTYKGTVAPPECNTFMSFCPVYYTPKGRGYDARVDKITASYAGDLYNSPTKVTETIRVTAAP